MDPVERAVLRRKVYLLKAVLPLNELLFKDCKEQGLLCLKTWKKIKSLTPEHEAYWAFIDSLEEQGKFTLEKFCYLLEKRGLSAAADELRAELQLEKKGLETESWRLEDTKCLLQKLVDANNVSHVTSIDQDSDCEKISENHTRGTLRDTEVQSALAKFAANRYMVGKETWKRQLTRKRNVFQQEKQNLLREVADAAKQVESLVRSKAEQLGHVIAWPEVETGSSAESYQAAFTSLRRSLRTMSEFSDIITREQNTITQERLHCFEMLGVPDTKSALNEHLELFLSKTLKNLDRTKGALADKSVTAQRLDSQIQQLRMEKRQQLLIQQYDIDTLQETVQKKENTIRTLEKQLATYQQVDDIGRAELEYWKRRCTLLEKTRRLGYQKNALNMSDDRKVKGLGDLKAVAVAQKENIEWKVVPISRGLPIAAQSYPTFGSVTPLSLSTGSSSVFATPRPGFRSEPVTLPRAAPSPGLAVYVKMPGTLNKSGSTVPKLHKPEK